MRKKVEREAPLPVVDINVTPTVDVMLVLLIIFMVITPMMLPGRPVELAQTRNPIPMQAADKSDAIVIAVEKDGKTYLNVTQMQPEDLPQKVKDLISNRTDKTVFVKADARAKYERVVNVADNLRAAGVDNVGLLTQQVQEKTGPGLGATPAAK
jgi:biopolymer transport protein ExbD